MGRAQLLTAGREIDAFLYSTRGAQLAGDPRCVRMYCLHSVGGAPGGQLVVLLRGVASEAVGLQRGGFETCVEKTTPVQDMFQSHKPAMHTPLSGNKEISAGSPD